MNKSKNKTSSKNKAKRSPSGKELASRSTASKSARQTKKSSSKYPKKEITIILLVFLTLALILSYYFNAFGVLGKFIRNMGCILFGACAYTIPVIVLIGTVHMFLRGTLSPHKHRYVFASLGIICISGLHTLYYTSVDPSLFSGDNAKFLSILQTVIESGKFCYSGGLAGALISLPLRALVSNVGSGIILVFLALISFVTATGTEPITRFAKFISSHFFNFVEDIEKERENAHSGEQIKIIGENNSSEANEKKSKKLK